MTKPQREAYINGTGMYVPERVLTNAELERMVDTSDEWIVTRTGIKERRIAAKGAGTSDLDAPAARDAIAEAGISPEEIDLIVCATFTPDTPCPAAAQLLQEKIGAVNAASFDLGAACSGFVYGLTTAKQFIATGQSDTVLVIGADKLSSVTNWSDRNTCVLFGDGAGAAIVSATPGPLRIRASHLASDGSMATLLHQPAGGSAKPVTRELVEEGGHFLVMNGRKVFKAAILSMEKAVDVLLEREGLSHSEIAWLLPHQANMRIIKVLGDYLHLPPEKVFTNVQRYGNTSAATTAIGLHELRQEASLTAGDKIVIVAFGAGFTSGACLLECQALPT